MRHWYRERRARRRASKVKPGDGSPLRGYRWWQLLDRSLFFLELDGAGGPAEIYAVDVRHFDWDADLSAVARLYRDGQQSAVAPMPAVFEVPGGRIEVESTLYGLKRMHLVHEDGSEQVLTPHPHSAEGVRATLDRRRPVLSKTIGVLAIIVLLGSLALGIPALLELVTQWDVVAEQLGTFTSPFDVPAWANTTVLVAAIVAATERALTLRNHWLIDLDTTFLGD